MDTPSLPSRPSVEEPAAANHKSSIINHKSPDLPFTPAPNESHKAFECFMCYFDIGQNRTHGRVAKKMGVGLGSVKLWARKFNWSGRMCAYNAHLLQTRVAVEAAARKDQAELWAQRRKQFKEQEWAASEKLLIAAHRALDRLLSKDPQKLTLADIARALEIASKLGRLSTGLATEHQEVTGPAGGPLQIELAAALKKVYGDIIDVEASPNPNRNPNPTPADPSLASLPSVADSASASQISNHKS